MKTYLIAIACAALAACAQPNLKSDHYRQLSEKVCRQKADFVDTYLNTIGRTDDPRAASFKSCMASRGFAED